MGFKTDFLTASQNQKSYDLKHLFPQDGAIASPSRKLTLGQELEIQHITSNGDQICAYLSESVEDTHCAKRPAGRGRFESRG